jgi:2-polyprenyl-6-methoxyphenol hydroxylase-like FAD-dependent oxidoreductase
LNICIVGGGIAGLGLAGFLEQREELECTVVEQAEEWERVGWGIGLWGTGIQVLKKLDVAQTALENGTEMNQYQLRNGKGEELASYAVDSEELEFLAVHRADLHKAIREAVPQEKIRMDTQPEEINQRENGVEVVFNDEGPEVFDAVIGADGMHSEVRSECFNDYKVNEENIKVWSFWTDTDKVPEGTTSIWTTGTEIFITNINGKGLANIATRKENGETIQEVIEKIGWKPLQKMVAEVDEEDLFSDTIKTVKSDNWTNGRVALMGDSAHALNPIVGMGASLALEDAYVLAEEIEGSESIKQAFKEYEKRRRKSVRSVRRKASLMEFLVFNKHSIVPYLGNSVLKHTSSLAEYYYDNMSFKELEDL